MFLFFCFSAQQKSRCEECNINFSKHQNYIAHKKYYCSAVSAGTAATGGPNTGSGGPGGNKSGVGGPGGGQPVLPIVSDNEDDKSSDDGKSQSHRKLSPPIASPSALMLGLTSPNRKEGNMYFFKTYVLEEAISNQKIAGFQIVFVFRHIGYEICISQEKKRNIWFAVNLMLRLTRNQALRAWF